MAVVKFPTEEEVETAYEAYALALGKVAHAWNMLFERLGRLFTVLTQMHPPAAVAIWNAPDSDRTKVEMLRAAVSHLSNAQWREDFPRAADDILWLLERVRGLTELRNNVIHAPCTLVVGPECSAIQADPLSGHGRAKKMWGKEILAEFDYCERWSDLLSHFADAAREALLYREYQGEQSSWPHRPAKPNRPGTNNPPPDLHPGSPT